MKFEDIVKINNKKIVDLREKKEIDEEAKKQLRINEKIGILLKDGPSIFFKIRMDESIKILKQIIDEEIVEQTYLELISPSSYNELLNKFEI